MRRTLGDALAKESRICEALNISPNDPNSRATTYINLAIERLMTLGHWWGTTQNYRVNVTEQLFSLPPQFANMEKIAIAQVPVALRNHWYEWQGNAIGKINDPDSTQPLIDTGGQALFRGNVATNKDIKSGSAVKVVADVSETAGAKVLVLGFDSNGNWVRTQTSGVWHDGEYVNLATGVGATSVTLWSRITDVQKPVTNGQVWLYDSVSGVILSTYQYWETRPQYQRYILPTLPGNTTQVDLIGKMVFIPVRNNTDYLLISNFGALKLAAKAMKLEEEGFYGDASMLLNGAKTKDGTMVTGAVPILEAELQHYQGVGFKFSVDVNTQFGERVPTLI